MARVSMADKLRPPTTTDPRPRYSSDPAPGKRTNGNMPKTLVRVDMNIGRMRFRVASRMASRASMPSLRIWNRGLVDEEDGIVDDDPDEDDEAQQRQHVERLERIEIDESQPTDTARGGEGHGQHDDERVDEALEQDRHHQVRQ